MKRVILLAIFLGLSICFPNLDTSTSLKGKEVDGIREDVLREIERKFKEKYKDRPDIYRAILLDAWVTQRVFEIDPTDKNQAEYFDKFVDISDGCITQSYDDYMIPYLEEKYGDKYPFENEEADREYDEGLDEVLFDDKLYILAITFNTYERAKFYEKFSQTLSGRVLDFETLDRLNQEGIGACEFLERVKKEWEKTGIILKIDIDQLIEQIKRER